MTRRGESRKRPRDPPNTVENAEDVSAKRRCTNATTSATRDVDFDCLQTASDMFTLARLLCKDAYLKRITDRITESNVRHQRTFSVASKNTKGTHDAAVHSMQQGMADASTTPDSRPPSPALTTFSDRSFSTAFADDLASVTGDIPPIVAEFLSPDARLDHEHLPATTSTSPGGPTVHGARLERGEDAAKSQSDQKGKRHTRSLGSKIRRRLAKLRKAADEMTKKAKATIYVCEGVDLKNQIVQQADGEWKHVPLPDRDDLPEINHSSDSPYVVVDCCGRFLYAVFPNFLNERQHNDVYNNAMAYGRVGSLKPCRDKKKKRGKRKAKAAAANPRVTRSTTRAAALATQSATPNGTSQGVIPSAPPQDESEYIITENGCLKGSRHLATWHQQGHKKGDRASAPSKDLCAPNRVMDHVATQNYLAGRTEVAVKQNMVLQNLLPDVHEKLSLTKEFHLASFPAVHASLENMRGTHLGLAAIYNKETCQHYDVNSPLTIPECLLTSGDYSGGDMILPQLNHRIHYPPGTMIIILGRILRHGIEPFSGKQRIVEVSFTHDSIIREAGVDMLIPRKIVDVTTSPPTWIE